MNLLGKTTGNTIIGAVLILGALVLWSSNSSPPNVIKAQGGDHYDSRWTATHLLTAARTIQWGWQDEIAFGVARWQVTGGFENGPYFKEVWQVADGKPVFEHNRGSGNVSVRFPAGDADKWLVGFVAPHNIAQSRHVIGEKGANSIINNHKGIIYNRYQNDGKSVSCHPTNHMQCIMALGAYSFMDYYRFASAMEGKHRNLALALPLEWRVTGRICQTRQECQ